jgi:hypothetical protein
MERAEPEGAADGNQPVGDLTYWVDGSGTSCRCPGISMLIVLRGLCYHKGMLNLTKLWHC